MRLRTRLVAVGTSLALLGALGLGAAGPAAAQANEWGLAEPGAPPYLLDGQYAGYGITYWQLTDTPLETPDPTEFTVQFENNQIPFVEIQPCPISGADATAAYCTGVFNNILAGKDDSYLTTWGQDLASLDPDPGTEDYLVTFAHEMNSTFYPWGFSYNKSPGPSAALYVKVWNYVTSHIDAACGSNCPINWIEAANVNNDGSNTDDPVTAGYYKGTQNLTFYGMDCYYANGNSDWANACAGSWNAMVSDWVNGEIGSTYGPMLTETGIPSTDKNQVSQVQDLACNADAPLMYFNEKDARSQDYTLSSAAATAFLYYENSANCV